MKSLFINLVRSIQKGSVKRQMKGQSLFDNVESFYDIRYKNDDNKRHVLDIHKPMKNNELLPVIISFHGGAFVGGEKWYNTEHCTYLAKNGYLVFNVEYTRCPEVSLFGEIREAFFAIKWIKEHISDYGGDINKISLMGDSAGSWIIMLFSIINKSFDLQKIHDVNPIKIKVNSLILISPVADIKKAMTRPCHIFWFKKYVFRENEFKYPYNLTSIQELIGFSRLEPCFIVTSSGDKYYYSFSLDLKKLFEKNCVNFEYIEYKNGERILEHCFNIMHPSYPESIDANNKILAFINKYN